MKKNLFIIGALAASFALTSCDEDFTDWAAPQTYAQEPDAAAQSLTVAAASTAPINAADAPESFPLLAVTAPANFAVQTLQVNDKATVPFTVEGNQVVVKKAQLDSAVRVAYFSQANAARTLSLKVLGVAYDASRQAVSAASNAVSVTYQTANATPAVEDSYYLVGGMNGWNLGGGIAMTAAGNGIFTWTGTVPADCYFKFFGKQGVTTQDWNLGMGYAQANHEAKEDFVNWTVNGIQPEGLKIAEGGNYKITLDVMNWTYKIEKQ